MNGYFYDERQKMYQRTAALHGLVTSAALCILFCFWLEGEIAYTAFASSFFCLCALAGYFVYIIETIWTDSYMYVNQTELFPYWIGTGILGFLFALNLIFKDSSPLNKDFWFNESNPVLLYGTIGSFIITFTFIAKQIKDQRKPVDTGKVNYHLITAMTEKKIASEQLAARIHISKPTMNAIENGEYSPSIALATEICRQLNCTLDELFEA